MHIIMGETESQELGEKYTVLELDKFRLIENAEPVQAYCVIENMAISDFSRLPELTNLHTKLMENYYKKNWSFCEQAIEHLAGHWNNELDTFYDEIIVRVNKYKEEDPGDDWDGVIDKN